MTTITIDKNNNDGWKNVPNTSDLSCTCGSWKAHWEKYASKKWPSECSKDGCNNKLKKDDEVGAHIHHLKKSKDIYITPFCKTCNSDDNKDEFHINTETVLVIANKSKTCSN